MPKSEVSARSPSESCSRSRLGAPKFRPSPGNERQVGISHGDPAALEKLLATFSVGDQDAAAFLNSHLAELSRGAIERGDLSEVNGALALLNELAPRDAAETMLCIQMIGAQMLSMQCLKKANLPGRSAKQQDIDLRHSERLMRIYTQQLDALNKHRGKGQQKVTVEHVTVNEGGQAVVGAISEAGSS